ncbi:MAG: hypothetical protein R2873_19920 [Caldilineaceae bacterium]
MQPPSMKPYAVTALAALLLAAATGALMRFSLVNGFPTWASNYTAIRHAHSHLMYFGWGTLAIMALIWRQLPSITGRALPRGVRAQMTAAGVAALLSFPAFWANGYGETQIGGLSLPLGAMVSGANGLTWAAFILLYARATWRLSRRPLPVRLWDAAIVLLILACMGVLWLMALVVTASSSFFMHQAALHLFLDLYAVGWFGLALLGLLWARTGEDAARGQWLPVNALALALAPTFFLGMAPAVTPPALAAVAMLGNVLAAGMLAWHGWLLWWQRARLPLLVQFGLLTLAVHALIGVVLIFPGVWTWAAGTQLRVFFLHNLLLGWLSSVLIGLIAAQWINTPRTVRRILDAAWIGGVGLMLLSLLGMGGGNLSPVSPLVWLQLAAWSSLLLVGVIVMQVAVAARRFAGHSTSLGITAEASG